LILLKSSAARLGEDLETAVGFHSVFANIQSTAFFFFGNA
jgi:hypothetical protein